MLQPSFQAFFTTSMDSFLHIKNHLLLSQLLPSFSFFFLAEAPTSVPSCASQLQIFLLRDFPPFVSHVMRLPLPLCERELQDVTLFFLLHPCGQKQS